MHSIYSDMVLNAVFNETESNMLLFFFYFLGRHYTTGQRQSLLYSFHFISTKPVSTFCVNHFKISSKYYISFEAAIILHIAYLLLWANIWPKLDESIRYGLPCHPTFRIYSSFDDDDDDDDGYTDGCCEVQGDGWQLPPERVWRNSIKIV